MSSGSKRIPSLDGIRAVSISLVLISHYCRDVGWHEPLDFGSLGVRIFFVISGYLITGLLISEMERHGGINLYRFYFRRTLRIFPAFYFYIACMLFLAGFGLANLTWGQAAIAFTYTSNYLQPRLPFTVVHSWSLATEEQFYLIWPAVLSISGRCRGTVALLGLLVAAPLLSHILSRRFGHVPAFFNGPIGIGCLLALVQDTLHRVSHYRLWVRSRLGLLLPLLIVILSMCAYHASGIQDTVLSLFMNATIALWIDWSVMRSEGVSFRCLNSRWVVYIGVLSYSLYLWQQPFLSLLHTHPALVLSGRWTLLSKTMPRFSMIAICTLISYYLVERPMLRFRSWLEPKIFSVQPAKKLMGASLGIPPSVDEYTVNAHGTGM